jgi:hypothetical protein
MVHQSLYLLRHGFGSILYDQRRRSVSEHKILGEDITFYSAEEVNIALNEGKLELNARVKLEQKILMMLENWFTKLFKLPLVVFFLMK